MKRMIHFSGKTEKKKIAFSLKVALSYIGFLLLCLTLGVVLYTSSTQNARRNFWEHRSVEFERAIASMDDDMAAMDSYTRQLLIDSTFIRFSGMEGIHQRGYIFTAYEVMQTLASRLYSISDLPILESRIYLKNSGYVISASQFTEARQFYENYRIYHPGGFEDWLDMVLNSIGEGGYMDISAFTAKKNSYVFIRDIGAIMNKNVPAVIWFEMDMDKLRKRFLPQDAFDTSAVIFCDAAGRQQLLLAANDESAALAAEMKTATFDQNGFAQVGDYVLIRRGGVRNKWQYTIALPTSICNQTLGNFDLIFWLLLAVAALGGLVMVVSLVRYNMRPIRLLDRQLKQAQGDRELLQQEMQNQRPMLEISYLRKLVSGHVTSNEEFDYMFQYLGLASGQQFYVLLCVAHRQDSAPSDPVREYELIDRSMRRFFDNGQPLYYYTTLDRSFVTLVTYDADYEDPLMDLQRRVLSMHNDLAENHSLWFYAGVGMRCTSPQSLWESYEQARRAARYTAKHRIFLPYEFIRKDTDSFYYPVQISSKLQNFITTGNTQQTVEMFAMLRRENLEERSLPMSLLNFLLSDLKNTLLKARFQATAHTQEDQERLNIVDERLYGQASFPLLEATAILLCECFTRAADPSDPIADIQRYLAENFTDPSMCLSLLSDQFHISESYLSHLFKNKTGQNFSVYLETLRLDEAAVRLKETDDNISTLYAELGYNNPTTFRRAFKKRYGITPSEMRAQK